MRVLLVALMLAAFAAPLATAAEPDVWYFTDVDDGFGNLVMYLGDDTQGSGGDVFVAAGDRVAWAADDAATANIPLGGAGQVYTITLLVKQGNIILVRFGTVAPDGAFTMCDGQEETLDQGLLGGILLPSPLSDITAREEHVTFAPDDSCKVALGDRIAIDVEAQDGQAGFGTRSIDVIILGAKQGSQATPPPPVPEIGSVLLVGAGIVALGIARRLRA